MFDTKLINMLLLRLRKALTNSPALNALLTGVLTHVLIVSSNLSLLSAALKFPNDHDCLTSTLKTIHDEVGIRASKTPEHSGFAQSVQQERDSMAKETRIRSDSRLLHGPASLLTARECTKNLRISRLFGSNAE